MAAATSVTVKSAEVFAARSPIFDQTKRVYGYELAYRGSWGDYHKAIHSGPGGTRKAELGIERLLGDKRGFLAFDRESLLAGFHLDFSGETAVVCLSAAGTDAELLQACQGLRAQGYVLALTGCDEQALASPLLPLATVASADFQTVSPDARQRLCQGLNDAGIAPMAGRLESESQFLQALDEGFKLFGGVFFRTPDIKPRSEKLNPNRMVAIGLLKEVNKPEVSPDELADIIQRDVGLTYNLLRMVNSAWFGFRHQIMTVRHALVCLGPREVRRWATAMAMLMVNDTKPPALVELSLTRAKFAESLAVLAGLEDRAADFFLLGMFSLLDAITDRPMEDILSEVALTESVKQAILNRTGDCVGIYKLMLAYEHGQWVLLADLAAENGIDPEKIPTFHREALEWSQRAHALIAA